MVRVLGRNVELVKIPGIRRIARPIRVAPHGNEVAPGLYVGNADVARYYPERFDRIISVADGLDVPGTTDSFNLITHGGTRDEGFDEAVVTAQDAWTNGETVLVHCHEGKERAPSVVAAVLAREWDLTFHQARLHIEAFHPFMDPTPSLQGFAQEHIREFRKNQSGEDSE